MSIISRLRIEIPSPRSPQSKRHRTKLQKKTTSNVSVSSSHAGKYNVSVSRPSLVCSSIPSRKKLLRSPIMNMQGVLTRFVNWRTSLGRACTVWRGNYGFRGRLRSKLAHDKRLRSLSGMPPFYVCRVIKQLTDFFSEGCKSKSFRLWIQTTLNANIFHRILDWLRTEHGFPRSHVSGLSVAHLPGYPQDLEF